MKLIINITNNLDGTVEYTPNEGQVFLQQCRMQDGRVYTELRFIAGEVERYKLEPDESWVDVMEKYPRAHEQLMPSALAEAKVTRSVNESSRLPTPSAADRVIGCVKCGKPCALVGDIIPEDEICCWCRGTTSQVATKADALWGNEQPRCDVAPEGWFCTRGKGHAGPCAWEKKEAEENDG